MGNHIQTDPYNLTFFIIQPLFSVPMEVGLSRFHCIRLSWHTSLLSPFNINNVSKLLIQCVMFGYGDILPQEY